MGDLIFLDTETTGLDPTKHEIWEFAYAIDDGRVVSVIIPHSLRKADPRALEMNGYYGRVPFGMTTNIEGDRNDLHLRKLLSGNTIVCANPTFDRMMMLARWGEEPYHYRAIDVESMALVVFDWVRPRGLKDIATELRSNGFDIPEPDHSAGKDVETLRACYWALRAQNKKYKIY